VLPVATVCRTLGVSTSGYYAWRRRGPSRREREDAVLTERIRKFHERSRGTYGAPRIHRDLAVVVDAFSRGVVGWAMSSSLKTQIVLDALNMALWRRRPVGVVHHCDQGSQYTSFAFGKRYREMGVRPSMGSVGDCYDNALCESFFATLECELLDRHRFSTHAEARMAIFEFIEGFYNPSRRHSGIDCLSPLDYERRYNLALENPNANLSTEPG